MIPFLPRRPPRPTPLFSPPWHTPAANPSDYTCGRNYDPSNPSQWNPYSIAMQAAEENRTRNADFMGNNSSNNPAQSHEGEGAGGARAGHSNGEADGGPGGRGIGAWFRGLGGGAGQGSGGAGAAENGGVGGGNAAPTGRGGRWWGMGGGGDRINEDGMKFSSPVQKQVKVLVEMGFEEVSDVTGRRVLWSGSCVQAVCARRMLTIVFCGAVRKGCRWYRGVQALFVLGITVSIFLFSLLSCVHFFFGGYVG